MFLTAEQCIQAYLRMVEREIRAEMKDPEYFWDEFLEQADELLRGRTKC